MRVQLPLTVRMISPISDNENERRLQSAQQQLSLAQLDRLHLQPTSLISLPISDSTRRPRRRKKRHRCERPRLMRSRRSRRLRVAIIVGRRRRRNDRGPALRGTMGARIGVVVVAPIAERRRIMVATCSLRHLPCRGLKRRPRCRRLLDPFRLRRLLAPRQGLEAQHPHRLRRVLRRALLGGRNRKFPLRLLPPPPLRATLLRLCRIFSPSPTRPPSRRSHSSRLRPLRTPLAQHLGSDPPSRVRSWWPRRAEWSTPPPSPRATRRRSSTIESRRRSRRSLRARARRAVAGWRRSEGTGQCVVQSRY